MLLIKLTFPGHEFQYTGFNADLFWSFGPAGQGSPDGTHTWIAFGPWKLDSSEPTNDLTIEGNVVYVAETPETVRDLIIAAQGDD